MPSKKDRGSKLQSISIPPQGTLQELSQNSIHISSIFVVIPYCHIRLKISFFLISIGHGTDNGELMFIDKNGETTVLSVLSLAALLKTLKVQTHILWSKIEITFPQGRIKCVVLNCCNSIFSGEALCDDIDFVIAMTKNIQGNWFSRYSKS